MSSVIEPLPCVAGEIVMPLIAAMSTAVPVECSDTLPDVGQVAVAAVQRGDRRPQAGGGEELERRQHAAVDLAGADVAAAALVDRRSAGCRARAARAPPCSSAGSGRSTGWRRRRRRTGSCPRRGRSRSTRAASSRRGSASGRSRGAPRPAGRISNSRCGAPSIDARRGGRGSCRRRRARRGAARLSWTSSRLEAEHAAEVALEGLDAVDHAGALELLLGAAGGRGVRAGRVGEQALLGGGRGRRRGLRGRSPCGRAGGALGRLALRVAGAGRSVADAGAGRAPRRAPAASARAGCRPR